MANGKQRDIKADFFHAIQKENHPKQKQNMIVARNHMFRAKIQKRQKLRPRNLLNIALVAKGHRMGQYPMRGHHAQYQNGDEQP